MALWWIKETDTTLREWDRNTLARLLGPSIGPEPLAKVVIGGKTLFPLTDAGSQPPAGQKLASRTVTDDGDVATAGYVYEAVPLTERKAVMKADITARRWEVETGGITVSGAAIATDAGTQAKLSGALQLVQADDQVVIDWKGANGWVQLNAAAVTAVAVAVGQHVQAAFTRENALHTAVDAAADGDDLDLIDIAAGSINGSGSWPN
jgi:hypothetical protein